MLELPEVASFLCSKPHISISFSLGELIQDLYQDNEPKKPNLTPHKVWVEKYFKNAITQSVFELRRQKIT